MKHTMSADLGVSRETVERLEAYQACLLMWNRSINLIARKDEPNVWQRHIADALQLLPLIPRTVDRLLDLGSGGGLPGLVLAIASNLHVTLIESDQRKCAFLQEAARAAQVKVTIVESRIERAEVSPHPILTSRALAPLPLLLSLAVRHIAPGGTLLAMKGRGTDAELKAAEADWHMNVEKIPSLTEPGATILQITELRRVTSSDQGRPR